MAQLAEVYSVNEATIWRALQPEITAAAYEAAMTSLEHEPKAKAAPPVRRSVEPATHSSH